MILILSHQAAVQDPWYTPVAVMDQARQINTITPTHPDPHLQRIDRQRRVQPRGHLPANDPTREHIQDERDIHPSANVRTYVMSATHNWLTTSAVKSRLTRSAGLLVSGASFVVRVPFVRLTPRRPSFRMSRSTVHRATSWPYLRSSA